MVIIAGLVVGNSCLVKTGCVVMGQMVVAESEAMRLFAVIVRKVMPNKIVNDKGDIMQDDDFNKIFWDTLKEMK